MDGINSELREQALESEHSVIGSMLIDPTVVGLCVAELTESDFMLESNKVLFSCMRAMFTAGKTIDPVTVLEEVAPGDMNYRRYVLSLMDATPTAANVEEYIERTRYNSQRMKLQAIGQQLVELRDLEKGQELVSQAQDILSYQGRNDEWDMKQAMLNFTNSLEHQPEYLPWGFPFLDEGLDVSGGKLIVLGGRPSDGKTALALHMAYTQSKIKNVGFFTLEDSGDELFNRLISSVSRVRLRDIYRRNLNDKSYESFATSGEKIISHNLRIIDSAGWTVGQIASRALQRKFDVIYIDYLQLISTPARRQGTRAEEVADISRALANFARRHKITVVALAQLSRGKDKQKREKPTMADLKESGQIEQDANVIMFIWREDESKSNTPRYLTIAKNKTGELGGWALDFQGGIQRFSGWEDVTNQYNPNFPYR